MQCVNGYYTVESLGRLMGDTDLATYTNFIYAHSKAGVEYELCASLNQYSTYDVLQKRHDTVNNIYTEQYIELKGRRHKLGTYPDCVVDHLKVKSLQERVRATGSRAFIVAIYYLSKKLLIWEIDPTKDYPTEKKLVEQTQKVANPFKVYKDIVKFPIDGARQYDIGLQPSDFYRLKKALAKS